MNWGDARLPVRFWDKVSPEPNSGCWLWTGATNGIGYGRFVIAKAHHYPHRLAVQCSGRIIAPGAVVDHLCRNTLCCNPLHLDVVSQRENCARGIKGALTTSCPHGHPYVGANLIARRNGSRGCRACKRRSDLRSNRAARRDQRCQVEVQS